MYQHQKFVSITLLATALVCIVKNQPAEILVFKFRLQKSFIHFLCKKVRVSDGKRAFRTCEIDENIIFICNCFGIFKRLFNSILFICKSVLKSVLNKKRTVADFQFCFCMA